MTEKSTSQVLPEGRLFSFSGDYADNLEAMLGGINANPPSVPDDIEQGWRQSPGLISKALHEPDRWMRNHWYRELAGGAALMGQIQLWHGMASPYRRDPEKPDELQRDAYDIGFEISLRERAQGVVKRTRCVVDVAGNEALFQRGGEVGAMLDNPDPAVAAEFIKRAMRTYLNVRVPAGLAGAG